MAYKKLRVAVSVDGLPEHHDIRRKPASYDRILRNIEHRSVNIHWVITKPMLENPNYLEEYVSFWSERPEVDHIWVSLYTPQVGEESPEKLTRKDRLQLSQKLPELARLYPKFLMNKGIAAAIVSPPESPDDCVFSMMSVNFSADLRSRIEPCVFGGTPDCTQCGCAISSALHWIRDVELAGPLKVGHLANGSIRVGNLVNRFRKRPDIPPRWNAQQPEETEEELVQLQL